MVVMANEGRRMRARQWRAGLADQLDLEAIKDEFLVQCGPHDCGLPLGCACPKRDHRSTMAALVAEIETLRATDHSLEAAIDRAEKVWLERAASVLQSSPRAHCAALVAAARADVPELLKANLELEARLALVDAIADGNNQPGALIRDGEGGPLKWVTHTRAALDGKRIEYSSEALEYRLVP